MTSVDPSRRCMSCNAEQVFLVCTKEYDGTHNTYYVCREHAKQVDVNRFTEITFKLVAAHEPKKQNKAKLLCFYADDAAAGEAGLKKGDLWCSYDSRVHEKN